MRSACGQRAAAISYHVLFSLVPFLALLLTVLELLLPPTAHERVLTWLVGTVPLPGDIGASVEGAIEQAGTRRLRAGAVALVGFVWAASGMMAAVRSAFRAVWGSGAESSIPAGQAARRGARARSGPADPVCLRADDRRAGRDRDEHRDRGGSRTRHARDRRDRRAGAARASLTLAFAAFALLYRVVPPVPVRLIDVLPGAAFATLGVHLAGAGFSVYLDRFADFDDVYGPLGTVLAFLLLVWVTAAVLLVGACVPPPGRMPRLPSRPGASRSCPCRLASSVQREG